MSKTLETDTKYQRARTAEHFAEREQMILLAAKILLKREGIENTSLSGIAREAKLAKSSLYRYFESREEILVRLLQEEADVMIKEFAAQLNKLDSQDELGSLAQKWAALCARRPLLCLLISQLSPILEHNLSVEKIIEAKLQFLQRHTKMAKLLSEAVPQLNEAKAAQAVQLVFTIVAGLWPMKAQRKNVLAALKHPDLEFLIVDFEASLKAAILVCLRGLSSD